MFSTSDPNELQPLTEIGNQVVQARVRKLPEFATSSKWGASAIVLQLTEGRGYEALVGFELRTPLEFPLQDTVACWGDSKELAVRAAVDQWLRLAFVPAMAVHSDKDPHARLGETTVGNLVYTWRAAEGVAWVTSEDAEDVKQLQGQLAERSLFERLGMGAVLPLAGGERGGAEAPLLCLKMRMTRAGAEGAAGASGRLAYVCKINNNEWPTGLELLKRFHLPGNRALEITQYLFIRRTGKRMAATVPTAVVRPAAAQPAVTAKKPWWKIW